MQKKVIALAVAGLVSGAAFAQTSVTLSGTVDLGYNFGEEKWDQGGVTQSHKYRNFRGGDGRGMSSSRLNIDVKEQLGSGLKAGYFHEIGLRHFAGDHNYDLMANDGVNGSLAAFNRSRQSFAYLESASAGRFQIGLSNLITDYETLFANVGSRNFVGNAYNAQFFGLSSFSIENGEFKTPIRQVARVNAMDLARANAISYYSPVFSGFQVMGQFGYGKSKVDNADGVITDTVAGTTLNVLGDNETEYKIYNVGLKYANGPLTAYIGGQKYETEGSATLTQVGTGLSSSASVEEDRREFIAAAAYDFGVAKLAGMYFDRKADINGSNDHKYRGGDIGVSVPVGQAELFANYGMGKNKFEGDGGPSWKIRTYQLGARYNLSKRTNVYALYGYGKAKEDREGSGTGKSSVASVGLRHSF